MERNTEIETEREVLKRIVAMLFSFALLAERASVRCYPVRCLVLWALRHGEAAARDWVLEGCSGDAPTAALRRNSPAEAIYLAQSFRALAHLLKRELRQEERLARRMTRVRANGCETDMPRHRLLKPNSIGRLVQAMQAVVCCLSAQDFEAARLDTS